MRESPTRPHAGQGRVWTLVTPEGVPLVFEIASASARVAAFAFDLLLITLSILIMALVLKLLSEGSPAFAGSTFTALIIVTEFVIWNGYFLFFELRRRGTTPGKRRLHLRVVSRDGGPLTMGAVFARNLLRNLELFLPLQALLMPDALLAGVPGWAALLASGWLLVFLVMPLINRDHARVGDLVAGTLVIVSPVAALLPDEAVRVKGDGEEDRYSFDVRQLDLYGIHEVQVLEALLRNVEAGRQEGDALRAVCDAIRHKIAWSAPVSDDDTLAFLRAFYRAQRGRLEHELLLGRRREHKRPGRLKTGRWSKHGDS